MSGYLKGGLRQKYIITKTSGREVDPQADYFVMRLDKDPHAVNALLRYAHSVSEENREFALDLFNKAEAILSKLDDTDSVKRRNVFLEKEIKGLIRRTADKAVADLEEYR